LFQIISDPGGEQRATLSLESMSTIPFQARARDVNIAKLREHSLNRRIPYFVTVFGPFRERGDQPDKNPERLCTWVAVIILSITNCEIQWPGMQITRKIGQVSLVGCTYDWHNRRSGSKLILCIPPPIARIHLAVDLSALRVIVAHRFKIEVPLKWEFCQQDLDTFENIPVV
jgi:hypothetical protein